MGRVEQNESRMAEVGAGAVPPHRNGLQRWVNLLRERTFTAVAWLLVLIAAGSALAMLPDALALQRAPDCASSTAHGDDCLRAVMGTLKQREHPRRSFESAWRFRPTTEVVAPQEFRVPDALTDDLDGLTAQPYVVALTWHGRVVGLRAADGTRIEASSFGVVGVLNRTYPLLVATFLLTVFVLSRELGGVPSERPRLAPIGLLVALVGWVLTQCTGSPGWQVLPPLAGFALWLPWWLHWRGRTASGRSSVGYSTVGRRTPEPSERGVIVVRSIGVLGLAVVGLAVVLSAVALPRTIAMDHAVVCGAEAGRGCLQPVPATLQGPNGNSDGWWWWMTPVDDPSGRRRVDVTKETSQALVTVSGGSVTALFWDGRPVAFDPPAGPRLIADDYGFHSWLGELYSGLLLAVLFFLVPWSVGRAVVSQDDEVGFGWLPPVVLLGIVAAFGYFSLEDANSVRAAVLWPLVFAAVAGVLWYGFVGVRRHLAR